jgi:hypothetical protein
MEELREGRVDEEGPVAGPHDGEGVPLAPPEVARLVALDRDRDGRLAC